jgi:hypothetical protein
MKPLMHFKRAHDNYFHPHPLHPLFSVVLAFILALVAVLALTVSAK